jgi:hypothetical protein
MPWPISAGVLGMLRTMRALPVAAAIESVRMPAITLRCSACATCGTLLRAAVAKLCGLTAHTTSGRPASELPPNGSASTPYCRASRARCRSSGSMTRMVAGMRPDSTSPPISALAMLPPPMKAIWGAISDIGPV